MSNTPEAKGGKQDQGDGRAPVSDQYGLRLTASGVWPKKDLRSTRAGRRRAGKVLES